jgi:hypothetical protein
MGLLVCFGMLSGNVLVLTLEDSLSFSFEHWNSKALLTLDGTKSNLLSDTRGSVCSLISLSKYLVSGFSTGLVGIIYKACFLKLAYKNNN